MLCCGAGWLAVGVVCLVITTTVQLNDTGILNGFCGGTKRSLGFNECDVERCTVHRNHGLLSGEQTQSADKEWEQVRESFLQRTEVAITVSVSNVEITAV